MNYTKQSSDDRVLLKTAAFDETLQELTYTNLVHATKITALFFFFTAIFHFLFLSYQYLVESLKTWFRRIAAFLVNCVKSALSVIREHVIS